MKTRRPRFFYGWVMVGVASIAGAFAPGIGFWGAGVLLPPMTEAFGWSRAEFLLALTIRSLTSAVIAPWVGPLFDTRNGPRRLMMVSTLAMGLSLLALRYINDDLWGLGIIDARLQFYFLFGVVGGLTQAGAGMAFGQTILPKWFIKRRGRVLGIAAFGTASGGLIFPPVIQAIVGELGFRWAWTVLGLAALAILFPLAFLVRTQPEDIGLLPDDAAPDVEGAGDEAVRSSTREHSFTRAEALRTPAFWFIAGAVALVSLGLLGFQSNWHGFFTHPSVGFAPSVVAFSVSFYAIFSMFARFGWGTLSDRFHPRNLWTIGMLVTSATIAFMLTVDTLPELLLFAAVHGVALGSFFILQPILLARYFGRAHIGAIFGLIRPVTALFGAASPLMIGVLYDAQGTYTLAFSIVGLAWFAAAIMVAFAVPPRRGGVPSAEPVR